VQRSGGLPVTSAEGGAGHRGGSSGQGLAQAPVAPGQLLGCFPGQPGEPEVPEALGPGAPGSFPRDLQGCREKDQVQ